MGQYVMCVERGDLKASLTVHKVYKRLPDETGEKVGMIRVIDDSEEDYLYSADWFVPVELNADGQQAFERVLA